MDIPPPPPFLSLYELIDVSIASNKQTIWLAVIYRPGYPGSDANSLCLESFNYWVDDPFATPYSTEISELAEKN